MNKSSARFHIGQRVLRSALGVGLCFAVYVLRGFQGIPFYSALAALQCMQPYRGSTRRMAVQRLTGTAVGAVFGLVLIVLQQELLVRFSCAYLLYCLAVMAGVTGALCTAVALHRKNAAYFSCVVFLSITMVHIGDSNPYLFVFNRVTDTLLGVAIGMGVNALHRPTRKRRDVLFVAALDDVLLPRCAPMSDYGRVELNRLLDEGLALSIMTLRTPASFLEAAGDLRLRLPVVLMDGAILYDPVSNTFPYRCELPHDQARELAVQIQAAGLDCFYNTILEDSVLIFHPPLCTEAARRVKEQLRRSPYRNYLCRPLPEDAPVAYLMAVGPTDAVEAARSALAPGAEAGRYRLLCYPSDEYPGCAYLKVYRRQATKLNTVEVLRRLKGYDHVRTIGSVAGAYDVCVPDAGHDAAVRCLKEEYERPYLPGLGDITRIFWKASDKTCENVQKNAPER